MQFKRQKTQIKSYFLSFFACRKIKRGAVQRAADHFLNGSKIYGCSGACLPAGRQAELPLVSLRGQTASAYFLNNLFLRLKMTLRSSPLFLQGLRQGHPGLRPWRVSLGLESSSRGPETSPRSRTETKSDPRGKK